MNTTKHRQQLHNNNTFHHRRRLASVGDLQNEFRRLHLNQLQTLDKVLIDFMTSRKGISFCSFNCQSLRAHFHAAMKRSNFLLLSATWLHNEERLDVPNFTFVVQFKRSNVRAGGVAIYRNANDRANIVTPYMDINIQQVNALGLQSTGIGNICAAKCQLENGQMIMMVAIYISNNVKVNDIIEFIHEVLLAYTIEGAALLKKDLDKMPMILSGDINFNSDEAQPLIRFLDENFNLKLNTEKGQSTTRSGTTIDAVFSRHLENVHSKLFVSYFSYHKPIIFFLEYESMEIDE